MLARRLLETAAMTIIGDSMLCVISPRRHVSLWMDGPKWWRRSFQPFVRHPDLTRALGVIGVGFGLWLAWRQEPGISLEEREVTLPRRIGRRLEEAAR
jgi:hypothetical protein